MKADYIIDGKKKSYTINEIINIFSSSMITGITNSYDMEYFEKILFYKVMPQMNLYELAEIEVVPRVNYRRFSLTPKGKKYVVFLQNKEIK